MSYLELRIHRRSRMVRHATPVDKPDDAIALYRRFNQFEPRTVVRLTCRRDIPRVLVQLGELRGLIYRSDKWQRGEPRTYIHFMENPPILASDSCGRQLYVLGGSYRVTDRGIEG